MTTKNIGAEGFRWFVGIVESIDDPLQLGRSRIRIFQEHEQNFDVEQLPWAIPLMSPTSASSQEIGISPNGISVGSFVVGFFIDGAEKQMPMILGSWYTMPGLRPENNNVNSLARGTNTLSKTIMGPEPASPYAALYPYNQVYKSKSGHIVEIDDTPGEERIHIFHKGGSYIEIDKNGNFVKKAMGNEYSITAKDKEVYIDGTINITINKDCKLNVKGAVDIKAEGKVTLDSSGKVSIKGSGVDIN